jgi:AcrR family transcriptional regulator
MKTIIRGHRTTAMPSSHERIREAAKSLFAKEGYEVATTADICRLAGTSQSQLIKHFTGKQGVLEAIFEYAWEQINPAIRLATEKVTSPADKLKLVVDMVLSFFEKDPELRTIFLLEARRMRGDGHMVVLVPGYIEFVKMLDGVMHDLATEGRLAPQIHPQALRSALMGAFEGLLRDRMLARRSHVPASYSEDDMRKVIFRILSCCLIAPAV